MTKALREAKVHTSWLSPDEEYEAGGRSGSCDAILDRRRPSSCRRSRRSRRASRELGIYNSLAQLLIKITAPGVPDFYQGTELWDLIAGRSRQPPAGRLRAARGAARRRWRRERAPASRALLDGARRRPRQAVHRAPRAGRAGTRCARSSSTATTCRCASPARAPTRVRVRAHGATAAGARDHVRAAAGRVAARRGAGAADRRGGLDRHRDRLPSQPWPRSPRRVHRATLGRRAATMASRAGRGDLFARFPVALLTRPPCDYLTPCCT